MSDDRPTHTIIGDDGEIQGTVEPPQSHAETPANPPPVPAKPTVPEDAPEWAVTLTNTVGALTDLITSMLGDHESGGTEPPPPDDTPVKLPWTHRGFFK